MNIISSLKKKYTKVETLVAQPKLVKQHLTSIMKLVTILIQDPSPLTHRIFW